MIKFAQQGMAKMENQTRTIKVWVALLASMTIGASVLLALDGKSPEAGAFSLASYTRLEAVQDVLSTKAPLNTKSWNRIEVCYSNTIGGNIEILAKDAGLSSGDYLNCHFVVCNGAGGDDGLIQATQRWKKQYPALPEKDWYGNRDTVRVCVIGDGRDCKPTDAQLRRVNTLLDSLCQRCDILPVNIEYPENWKP